MGQALISLGSNLGNRVLNLNIAIQKIQEEIGNIIAESSIYESAPWGFDSKTTFLNQVIEIETELAPIQLLNSLLKIENELGRTRNLSTYESRIIDLDILFYGDEILNTEALILPHPRIQDRKFVLMPMNEILPEFVHPQLKKTIQQLFDECPDKLWVKKFIR
jgi:2-amino-4-hydroxy-6-hydroxymethyldihydropteridine diphosphokinase